MNTRPLAPAALIAAGLLLAFGATHEAVGLAAFAFTVIAFDYLRGRRKPSPAVPAPKADPAPVVPFTARPRAATAPLAGLPAILREYVVPVAAPGGRNIRLRVLSVTPDDAHDRVLEWLDDAMPGERYSIGEPVEQGTPTFGADTTQERTA